jgi:nitrite reductase/ring-hydroxylating ferredoxin subunit
MSMEQKQGYCVPIQSAVDLLVSQGGKLMESKDGDPHFKEVRLTLGVTDIAEALQNAASVLGIEAVGGVIRCTCHWSTISLTQMD